MQMMPTKKLVGLLLAEGGIVWYSLLNMQPPPPKRISISTSASVSPLERPRSRSVELA